MGLEALHIFGSEFTTGVLQYAGIEEEAKKKV